MRWPLKSMLLNCGYLTRASLLHKGLLLVSIPLVCQLVFLSGLGFVLSMENAEKQRARHAEAVVSTVTALLDRYYEVGRALLGYASTKNSVFEGRFKVAASEIPETVAALEKLVEHDKRESELVARIKVLDGRVEAFLSETKAAIDYDGSISVFFEPKQMDEELRSLLLPVSALLQEVKAQEGNASLQNRSLEYWTKAVTVFIVCGVPLNIVISLGLAVLVYSSTATRLRVLMDNNTRLAQHTPLNPELTGNDEIATVDKTFHSTARALAQVDELKRDFIRMISHDLRTPLTTVQLQLEVLADRVSENDAVAGKLLSSAQLQVERILVLTNQLLDLESLSGGKYHLDVKSINVDEMLSESADSLRQQADSMGIKIEVSPTDLFVLADEQRMSQVLANLLSNAIKASSRETTIRIVASRVENDNLVKIDIVDEGRGIPIGCEERIFERVKLGTLGAGSDKVAGFGLFISRAIIEQHGGTISARRNADKGTTISFTLPIDALAEPVSRPHPESQGCAQ